MALKEDNYWGKRTPATAKQIKRVPNNYTSVDNTSGLSDADLAVLQARLKNPDIAQQVGQTMGDQFVDVVAPHTVGMNIGGMYGLPAITDVTAGKKFIPPDNGPRLGETLTQGASKGIGDILGGISGIAKGLFGGGDQANSGVPGMDESPEALYERLRKESGQYTYGGPSAEEMAKREFDPQFALLDQIAKQTTDRYNSNKADITGMYRGLETAATADRAADQKNFAGAVGATGTNYSDASKNISDNSTAYAKAMAQQLAALGVKEGLGDVTGQVQSNLQDNLGQLNKQGAATKDLLTGLGANEYAFDTRNIGTARQAGLNTQEQFLTDFMDRMGQNDNNRLQLTGQRGQAMNNYDMQIQKLLEQGQADHSSSIDSAFKSILGAQQQNTDNYFKQAGLDLDLKKYQHQVDQDSLKAGQQGLDTSKMNAYDALMARAMQQYGGDATKARQAANDILAAYQKDSNPQSVGDFLNSLAPDSPVKTNPEMTSLLYEFLSKALPRK